MKEGLGKTVWDPVRRFPITFLVVLAAAVEIVALTGGRGIEDWRLMAGLSLGLPLSIAYHLFAETVPPKWRTRSWIAGAAVFAALGLYAASLPSDPEAAPDYIIHRHVVLFIGLHLVVSFAAFLAGRRRKAFWSFNKTLFLRILAAVLFSGTLYLGLLLVVGGLGSLFGAGNALLQWTRVYLAVLVFLIFNTWFFLVGVPRSPEDVLGDYPRGLRNFCGYVLSPLILLSAVILLLLVAKQLILGETLPEGFSFVPLAVVGILTYLLIYPLDGKVRWATLYRKFYFAVLLPFAFLQIYKLIGDPMPHGLKEEDYYYFILSIWAALVSLYLLFGRGRDIVWIPVSLALIAFLSIWGPWSAYSLSQRSQLSRLKALGEGILPLDWKTAAKTINTLSAERAADFFSQADSMNKFYGMEAFASIFREPPPADATWREISQAETVGKASSDTSGKAPLGVSFSTSSSEEVIDVKGFDRYFREVHNVGPSEGPSDCSFELCAKVLDGENKILLFDRRGEKRRIDVGPFLKRLAESVDIEKEAAEDGGSTAYLEVGRDNLKYDFPNGRLLFWTVFFEKKDTELRLKAFQTNVLLAK